ncbi:MAG TPA: hypothetical protein EYP19_13370, partial [Desulfobacterales bacterium]|nr:hypothetical protein [Desulfobacterales bacterium]
MNIWVEDSLQKVFLDAKKPKRAVRKLEFVCARGEKEDAQIVAWNDRPLSCLRIEFSDLKRSGRGSLPASVLSARFVRYVPLFENTKDNGEGKYIIRRAPGFFPDPLVPASEMQVQAKVAQPVWITVSVPRDAEKGKYRGTVTIYADGNETKIPVNLEVLPITLPGKPSLYLTNWLSLDSLEHFYNAPQFSEEWWSLIEKVAANMAEHRQNVILTPIQLLVDFHQTELGFRSDFAKFDRWVSIFDTYGVAQLIEGTHLAGRSGGWESDFAFRPFILYDRNGTRHELPATLVTDAERQKLLRLFLTQLYEHLDEKGWAGRFIIHLADEPVESNSESYCHLAEFVKS